jgi:hypothetical protein
LESAHNSERLTERIGGESDGERPGGSGPRAVPGVERDFSDDLARNAIRSEWLLFANVADFSVFKGYLVAPRDPEGMCRGWISAGIGNQPYARFPVERIVTKRPDGRCRMCPTRRNRSMALELLAIAASPNSFGLRVLENGTSCSKIKMAFADSDGGDMNEHGAPSSRYR